MKVLAYDNDHDADSKNASVVVWKKSCEAYGWDYEIYGNKDRWIGFCQRGNRISKEIIRLLEKYGEDLIIVVTDVRDCVANRTPNGMIDRFKSFNARIVFGCEMACCVDPMHEFPPGSYIQNGKRINRTYHSNENKEKDYSKEWISEMKAKCDIKNKWFRSLNAGMYIGYATDIKRMIDLKKADNREDDQALWTELFISNQDIIKLDYDQVLLSNCNPWNKKSGFFFSYDESRKMWKNEKTETYPYFVHAPGAKADGYKSYHKLAEKWR